MPFRAPASRRGAFIGVAIDLSRRSMLMLPTDAQYFPVVGDVAGSARNNRVSVHVLEVATPSIHLRRRIRGVCWRYAPGRAISIEGDEPCRYVHCVR